MWSGETMLVERDKIAKLKPHLRRAYLYSYQPLENTNLYDEKTIREICEKYKIPSELKDELFNTLERAAKRYALLNYHSLNASRTGEVRENLEALRADAESLLNRLEDWRTETALVFNNSYEWLLKEAGVYEHKSKMAKIGAFVMHDIDGQLKGGGYLSMADIRSSLGFICLISDTALESLEPDKGGRPQDKILLEWVIIMGEFWRHKLGRKFTVDAKNKKLLTKTGYFLTDCLTPLEPDDIDKLHTQMRSYKRLLAETPKSPA